MFACADIERACVNVLLPCRRAHDRIMTELFLVFYSNIADWSSLATARQTCAAGNRSLDPI